MSHSEAMYEKPEQEELDFNREKEGAVIENALCFDGRQLPGKQIVRRLLTSIGGGLYVDGDDWIYEKALSRESNGPEPRFVCKEERYDREGQYQF